MPYRKIFAATTIATALLLPLSWTDAQARRPIDENFAQTGTASWYGPGFHGRKTASGERFDQNKLTAAHRSLPLDTKVKVTNLENGRSVEVEINDRGPYVGKRVIDLSKAAANRLDMTDDGTARVRIEVIELAEADTQTQTASRSRQD
jgi:rare lipoprotein A